MNVFIFITCVCLGVVSGVVYDVLYIARCAVCGVQRQAYTVKDRIFIVVSDILYFVIFSAGYVFVSVMFGFDRLRLYMLIGCLIGAMLYLKSIHVIVAFSVKKVYNKITAKKGKKK